ncbi:hypothetical protein ARMGADRAFT_353084 [Armillaria gallica]|uniref:Uncharacterized protein n=1 Tax=Armillaria gallica TaxID=47427 RepID=A0A2H3D088_ARMGA|nr:hypothetical protein ARMGADRAFT_353084 [Armillaria gallica]
MPPWSNISRYQTQFPKPNSDERCPTTLRSLSVQQVLHASTTPCQSLYPLHFKTSSAAFLAQTAYDHCKLSA